MDDAVNRAIALIDSGEKIEARGILEQIVKDDPKNDVAWMWLADTFSGNPTRIAVLEDCLKYNPNNQTVQKRLASLKSEEDTLAKTLQQDSPDLQPGQSEEIREFDEEIPQSVDLSHENAPKQHTKKSRLYIVLASILGLVILGSVCVFGSRLVKRGGALAIPLVTNLLPSPTTTNRPTITSTPMMTATQLPTDILISYPISDSSPKTIEGAKISVDDKSFSFPIIAVYNVQSSDKIGGQTARAGRVFAIVHTSITNPDPRNIATYGRANFLAIGEDGIMIYPTYAGLDCEMENNVNVMQGATVDTCLIFEAQPASTFTFMFAPYQYAQLASSLSLSWEIIFK
jgi:hypothetical protein